MGLTKGWKQSAILKIIGVRTKLEAESLNKEFSDFGIKFMKKLNKPFKKYLDLLPKEYLNFKQQLTFKYGDGYSEYKQVDFLEEFPVPIKDHYNGKLIIKGNDKKEFLILIKKQRRLEKFRQELKEELFKVITPCVTTKMLIKVFPEIRSYVAIPEDTKYALVVQTDKLKKMLKNDDK